MPPRGYTLAKATTLRRLVVGVEAMEKEGKTTFALTAPDPIAVINMDVGMEGVVDKWVKKKKVWVATIGYRDVKDPKEWVRARDTMEQAYLDALADKDTRTLVMDTGTEVWELERLAEFGKIDHIKPHHYGPVNARMRDLIKRVYDTGKNLIILHKMKEQYVDDKATGRMIRSGFGDMPYIMQVNVRLWRRSKEEKKKKGGEPVKGDLTFGLTVLDCRQNAELTGEVLEEPMNDFATLATMVYPDTKEEDWT